jgi:hypothetical protein
MHAPNPKTLSNRLHFFGIKNPRTHNVKLDQFHLLYPKLMLDSIKFEKISEGSAGFGQKLTIFHVFRTQSNLVRSFQNFMESNISFG